MPALIIKHYLINAGQSFSVRYKNNTLVVLRKARMRMWILRISMLSQPRCAMITKLLFCAFFDINQIDKIIAYGIGFFFQHFLCQKVIGTSLPWESPTMYSFFLSQIKCANGEHGIRISSFNVSGSIRRMFFNLVASCFTVNVSKFRTIRKPKFMCQNQIRWLLAAAAITAQQLPAATMLEARCIPHSGWDQGERYDQYRCILR